jgi:hypothetical protein
MPNQTCPLSWVIFGEVGINLKSKEVKFEVGVKWVMNLVLLVHKFLHNICHMKMMGFDEHDEQKR